MKSTNKEYRDSFFERKASELDVESLKEAKQIYEGLKHYNRIIERYGVERVQQWTNISKEEKKSLIGGER
ncbi:hypothetical protein [Evansella cellulosilytica]|uniref:Uncharacterized protein n=1 Tax=Evansella cellulosilytica (strain ATCC 21833 / DSM 2522 / FERM P-1141 / JCM 9156 / N-4) TaxID=649639 RepID=E6TU34_EVAC2|nr:hypothetical protein [Evansella cellulosilytica]ADU28494.1 hypothetical protein Bcell_0206 [Evansella cellulosilytica DSM 2522]